MSERRFEITDDPLDAARIAASVSTPACGAVATFVGLVRDHNAGRRVLWLDYEAYAPLARTTFERIGDEAAARWPSVAPGHPPSDWHGSRLARPAS